MPRKPRNIYETNILHIIVQGLNKEFIFKNVIFKEYYFNSFLKIKEECNVEIIAYCIMGNHAHFILYSEHIENISKLMKRTNTKFAKFYNNAEKRVGYVFKDRFLSEPITNINYLIRCINYIHNNPVKANIVRSCDEYRYSSYSYFITGTGIEKINRLIRINIDNDIFINPPINIIKFDIDVNKRDIMDYYIWKFKKDNNLRISDFMENKEIVIKLIKYMREEYKINYIDIMKKMNVSRRFIKMII